MAGRRGAVLAFDRQCGLAGLPVPVPEYPFHKTRQWRFDWAWLAEHIALEIEGGAFVQGRHTRGRGFENDLVKYAEAAIDGWTVLRVTPDMVSDGRALGWLERLIASRAAR